jgi:hypothetical protein
MVGLDYLGTKKARQALLEGAVVGRARLPPSIRRARAPPEPWIGFTVVGRARA